VINKATATVTLSDLTQTYTGSPLTPTVTTIPASLSIVWTNAPQTNAGSYTGVVATVNDPNYQGSATDTFVINKATATITLSALIHTYDGTPKSVIATTNPSGLIVVSITYDGFPTAPSAIGTYAVEATLTNDNYQADPATGTLEITAIPTYSVSGYVFNNLAAVLDGVLVQNGSHSGTTIPSGYYSISGLVDGVYNFSYSKLGFDIGYLEVTITGADVTDANVTILDTTAPDTIIDSTPPTPSSSSSATFTFSSTEVGSTFQCQLDSNGFSTCSSPAVYNGLVDGSHTFEVKATDAMGNADATPASFTWTITTTASDTIPPSAIIDLDVGGSTANTITLTWTAPGDDGSSGTATEYDIRYSTSPINDGNWDSATPVTGEPAPGVAGTSESMVVTGLSSSTMYYFAMKTSDEVPNESGISNFVFVSTSGLPTTRYINGTVTNGSNPSEKLAGVQVTSGIYSATTDLNGNYSLAVVSGTFDLTFNKNDIRYYTGSLPGVSTVTVAVANGDFELQLKPVGTISGTVSQI
ncbi:MAG: MBG domain-containing protein, partial [Candidatus Methanoperedens sp.]|nr:MBG domain-containing protein [Candidatus Methanoperedens sp.]